MLGLAAVAALAAMAFVGASTALADVPCLESGLHATGTCGSVWAGNIKGLTPVGEPALLLGPNLRVEEACHGEGLALGATGTNEGSHTGFKILLEPLNFSGCKGLCEEVVGENPSWLLLEALTLDGWVTSDGTSKPGAKFQKCPLGVTCLYTLSGAEPWLLKGESDLGIADHVALARTQGTFCPSEAFADAKILLTKDEVNGAPIYLASLP
jgi:hypothetical protein